MATPVECEESPAVMGSGARGARPQHCRLVGRPGRPLPAPSSPGGYQRHADVDMKA